MLETQRTHSNGIQQKLEDQIELAERLSREVADQNQVLKVSSCMGPVLLVTCRKLQTFALYSQRRMWVAWLFLLEDCYRKSQHADLGNNFMPSSLVL